MTARNITIKQLESFRKKHGLGKNDSLSPAQFRELQEMSKKSPKSKDLFYSFSMSVSVIEKNVLLIELTGKHLSQNAFNALPMWGKKGKYHYRKAFKTAGEQWRLQNAKTIKYLKKQGIIPAKKATVLYTFHNTVSRDWDNNAENIKRVQDLLPVLGFIVDDKREVLSSEAPKEVIIPRSEEYKIVVKLIIEDQK